ncbi:MAG: tRNA pseudouridine synthase [Flavipsychrobacter sp.]|nr:tRNA pseudouridine synthase [Flavipsychrobacter sp.]
MRYVLEVMYDGVLFHGSQIQGDTPTVQLAINKALSTILRTSIISYGASRTDEGVHAMCNYYHFDIDTVLDQKFLYNCNAILPHGLAIKRMCKAVNPEFNARFDAVARRYRYRIYFTKNPFLFERALYYPFRFDHDILHETAAVIKEYTDFESFAKRNAQVNTFNCGILQSYWERNGDELHYIVEANRFLRGMVRGLVGTQLHMARYNGTVNDLRSIIEGKDCRKAFFDVAGHGLYLEEITYPDGALEAV